MLRKYVGPNNKSVYLTDKELKIIAEGAKKENNEDVLKRVYLANPDIDKLDVNNKKAMMGKEILKLCCLLIGEAVAFLGANQIGIPLPVIFLVSLGLTRFQILNMLSIADEEEKKIDELDDNKKIL